MIYRQTIALLVDAYRELNSKWLFWVTILLSMLALLGFAGLHVEGTRVAFLSWLTFDFPTRSLALHFYKQRYTIAMVGFWLSFGTPILALISISSIFPDLLSSGSIDLYLSKPLGRLRFFLSKYLFGLGFVALQLVVFAAGSYLVLGWRGGLWQPSVFMTVPIVLCFFSYLYSFAVLFGVWTRSALTALLLTGVAWLLIWGVGALRQAS